MTHTFREYINNVIIEGEFKLTPSQVRLIGRAMAQLPDGSIQITDADTMLAPSKEILVSTFSNKPNKVELSVEKSPLDNEEFVFEANVYTDGRRTEVQITEPDVGGYIAVGLARRRKGEKPKQGAATALAMARAFRSLSEFYFKAARVQGIPEARR